MATYFTSIKNENIKLYLKQLIPTITFAASNTLINYILILEYQISQTWLQTNKSNQKYKKSWIMKIALSNNESTVYSIKSNNPESNFRVCFAEQSDGTFNQSIRNQLNFICGSSSSVWICLRVSESPVPLRGCVDENNENRSLT